jgi:GTPase SAR1 family protein
MRPSLENMMVKQS